MRYWVLLIILLSVLSFWSGFIFWRYKPLQKLKPETNLAVRYTSYTNREGTPTMTKSVAGVVNNWTADKQFLTILIENKTSDYHFSPAATVLIPIANSRGTNRFGIKSDSPHWPTAFCPGDLVNLKVDSIDQVQFAINTGSRPCGLKGVIN